MTAPGQWCPLAVAALSSSGVSPGPARTLRAGAHTPSVSKDPAQTRTCEDTRWAAGRGGSPGPWSCVSGVTAGRSGQRCEHDCVWQWPRCAPPLAIPWRNGCGLPELRGPPMGEVAVQWDADEVICPLQGWAVCSPSAGESPPPPCSKGLQQVPSMCAAGIGSSRCPALAHLATYDSRKQRSHSTRPSLRLLLEPPSHPRGWRSGGRDSSWAFPAGGPQLGLCCCFILLISSAAVFITTLLCHKCLLLPPPAPGRPSVRGLGRQADSDSGL